MKSKSCKQTKGPDKCGILKLLEKMFGINYKNKQGLMRNKSVLLFGRCNTDN